jgi:drug/metabolite transporter, DME family
MRAGIVVRTPEGHVSATFLAIVSSACFAGAFVLGKRGLATTSFPAAVIVTLGTGWAVTAVAAFANRPVSVSAEGVGLFLVTGLVAPGIGYSAALAGVQRMGPSISVPIQQGARPVVSVVAAAAVLGETVGWTRIAGVIAILVGSIGLARGRGPSPEAVDNAYRRRGSRVRLGSFRPGILYPVVAALAFAAFDIMVKRGLGIMNDPTFAAALTLGSGFVAWGVVGLCVPSLRRSLSFPGVSVWVALGGTLFGFAALSVFHALSSGPVSLVSPLLATQPLLVFVLSRLALHDLEPLSARTVALGTLVVAGTLLIVA